jgi:hypothetical protein
VRGEFGVMLFPMRLIEFATGKFLASLADHLLRPDRKYFEKTVRNVSESQVGVHFIDPVAGGVCYISKSLLARLDRKIVCSLCLRRTQMR